MVGFATTNADKAVTLFGGRVPFHGTNPLAFAAPSGGERPWLLDMATSSIPFNRVLLYRVLGQTLPRRWRRTRQGAPTRDPQAVAMLLPLRRRRLRLQGRGAGRGGDDPLRRAAGRSARPRDDPAWSGAGTWRRPRGMGHFVLAIDPAFFGGRDAFAAGMRPISPRSAASPARPGEAVMAPGDREWRVEAERERDGIPLDPDTAAFLGFRPTVTRTCQAPGEEIAGMSTEGYDYIVVGRRLVRLPRHRAAGRGRGAGAAARGGAGRPQPADPHAGGLREAPRRRALHVVLQVGAAGPPRRAHAHRAAGPRARRRLLGQRHGLYPRPGGGLRPLGRGDRRPGLELRRAAALFHRHGGQRAAERPLPRHRRPVEGLRRAPYLRADPRLPPRGAGHRPALQPRLQRRDPARRRHLADQRPRRPALLGVGGLPAAGDEGDRADHAEDRRARPLAPRSRRAAPWACAGARGARRARRAPRPRWSWPPAPSRRRRS